MYIALLHVHVHILYTCTDTCACVSITCTYIHVHNTYIIPPPSFSSVKLKNLKIMSCYKCIWIGL